jgi:hypothetical protein
MISKEIFFLFILLLIPNNIEFLLQNENNNGNIVLHGIYLDIYYKRNLFYLSLLINILSYFLNLIIYGFFINILFLCLFIYTINKWSDIILCNIYY